MAVVGVEYQPTGGLTYGPTQVVLIMTLLFYVRHMNRMSSRNESVTMTVP